jgi:hypothetical protein
LPEHTAPAKLTPAAIVLTVLAPFAFGYFLSYLFRAVNAVVGPDLATDIGLSATALGLLTSAYLFAFALFQLPLGVLLDRYGPRRVQTGLFGCAAAGSLLFSIGDDVVTLTVARALIGLGFAGGLMSGFKAVVLWVPEPRRALANASVMSFGALGLLVATVPMQWGVPRPACHDGSELGRRPALDALEFIREEKDFPSVQCFAKAFEFLDLNRAAGNWLLQIETFDPHEPFTAPARFREAFTTGWNGPIRDWPVTRWL